MVRLSSFNGNSYTYNYAGIRISKTANGVTTKFAINDNNIISKQKGSNLSTRITYFYGLDGLSAFKYFGATYYYKKNFLGDIIGIYNSLKQLVCKYVYDAWGNCKVLNPDGTENFNVAFIGNVNPFRYRSYYFDVETGLYYLQSRYYDPQVGRFISMDSVEYLAPDVVNGLNLYSYCDNCPTMGYDPDGTFWFTAITTVIGALVGAAVNTFTYLTTVDGPINGKDLAKAAVSGAVSGAVTGFVLGISKGTAIKTASYLSAAAGSVTEEIFDYASGDKKINFENLGSSVLKVAKDTVVEGTFNYIFNKGVAKMIPTNSGWFIPKKFASYFTKSYGQKMMQQTVMAGAFTQLKNTVEDWMEDLFRYEFKKK